MADWLMILAGAAGLLALLWFLSFGSRGKQLEAMRKMSERSSEAPGDPAKPVILKPVGNKVWAVLGSVALVFAGYGLITSGYLADILKGQAL